MIDSMIPDLRPRFGKSQIPSMGSGFAHTSRMEAGTRKVLADNVKALMAARKAAGQRPWTIIQIVEEADGAGTPVSKGVVERMTKAEVNTGVDHLDGVAKAFGIEAWQLLVPDLDAANPPMLTAVAEEERQKWQRAREAAQEFAKLGS